MAKQSGIYIIENSVSGKMYIGQSSDLARRKRHHFSCLSRNCHYNQHLQNAYNKYGKKAFEFRTLLLCEAWELTRYEQLIVDMYSPEILFNIRTECVASVLGYRHAAETREKMSINHADVSGKNNPMFGKMGGMFRKTHSEETKAKMSNSKSRSNLSSETLEKMSKAQSGENNPMFGKEWDKHHNYGKSTPEETRKKISDSVKAWYSNNKNHNYGKQLSEEHRRKLSESKKAYYANKKKLEGK